MQEARSVLACENSSFSLLLAAGDVSQGGSSATQQQKFNTNDLNQCLHTKPVSVLDFSFLYFFLAFKFSSRLFFNFFYR